MTKTHENKLTMYEAVQTILDANASKAAAIPAFAGSVTKFKGLIQSIKGKSMEYLGASAGKAAAKGQAEEDLLTILTPVASGLFVMAVAQKNVELQEKVTLSERAMRRARDTEVAGRAAGLLALAKENQTSLAAYGVTDVMLSDLESRLAAFNASIANLESGVAGRVVARATIYELFDEADRVLTEEIDRLMEMMLGPNPQFYNEYFAARVIKDLGIRHRAPAEPPVPAPTT